MGLNGRKFVEENFSINVVVNKIEKIYREVTESRAQKTT